MYHSSNVSLSGRFFVFVEDFFDAAFEEERRRLDELPFAVDEDRFAVLLVEVFFSLIKRVERYINDFHVIVPDGERLLVLHSIKGI